jgi:hypothetical protein
MFQSNFITAQITADKGDCCLVILSPRVQQITFQKYFRQVFFYDIVTCLIVTRGEISVTGIYCTRTLVTTNNNVRLTDLHTPKSG